MLPLPRSTLVGVLAGLLAAGCADHGLSPQALGSVVLVAGDGQVGTRGSPSRIPSALRS